MKNDNIINNSTDLENAHKVSHFIPLAFQKSKDSIFIQKAKEYMQSKKSVSMNHIFEQNDKISIKINQNININTNIKKINEEKENENEDNK